MNTWNPAVVELGSLQWEQAVSLKRERAFAMCEREGLTRQEIEGRYDGYQREQGIAFHDHMLRREVTGGQLLGWEREGRLLAYASVSEADLLGDKGFPILNVLDVCVHAEVTQAERDAIVSSLLDKARQGGAVSAQVYCNPSLYASVVQAGGESVRQWFQFHLRDRAEASA